MPTAYTNAIIHSGDVFEEKKAVLTDVGIITDVVDEDKIPERYQRIDLEGMHLASAFIDLQIYGGNGRMFSDHPDQDSLERTYAYCKAGGASQFMITLATNSMEVFIQGIDAVREYWRNGGKGLLGLHLEGPYLNKAKRGAHLEKYIKSPTVDELSMLMDKGSDVIKMMTVAPEMCSDEVIDFLTTNIMIVSAGHTDATYAQAKHGFSLGIPAATHLYNAMSPLQHRAPGMVGAVFNDENVMASIVCDGIHVDYAAVKVAKKMLGNRLFYITDAVSESSGGEYQHILNGDRYTLADGTLSGSSLDMMQCVKNGIKEAGIDLCESIRMANEYPGYLIKNDVSHGCIAEGHLAQFVVFNGEMKLLRVIA